MNQILRKAPGPGKDIADLLFELIYLYPVELPSISKGVVTHIQPGDLQHRVNYVTPTGPATLHTPLLINALGIGTPVPISNPEKMTTHATPEQAGYRWQQVITPERAQRWKGKTLTFIGLGNSTGEMLAQIAAWERQGISIEYRILTHYPLEAILFPEETITGTDNKQYRLFRDIQENLVDYAGDLEPTRDAYTTALQKGNIITDVKQWEVKEKKGSYVLHVERNEGTPLAFTTAQLFTLIGYGQSLETLRTLGITLDSDRQTACYDYDGEFQRTPGTRGRKRLFPGYFGLGAILNTPSNPNAIVIPGMCHTMYDLMLGIALRAYEFQRKQQQL